MRFSGEHHPTFFRLLSSTLKKNGNLIEILWLKTSEVVSQKCKSPASLNACTQPHHTPIRSLFTTLIASVF